MVHNSPTLGVWKLTTTSLSSILIAIFGTYLVVGSSKIERAEMHDYVEMHAPYQREREGVLNRISGFERQVTAIEARQVIALREISENKERISRMQEQLTEIRLAVRKAQEDISRNK